LSKQAALALRVSPDASGSPSPEGKSSDLAVVLFRIWVHMKKAILPIMFGIVSTIAFAADTVSSTTTTTSSMGTVAEYAPGSTFVVKETSGPVKYRYGKQVTSRDQGR
jgi:hypothetical protein